MQTTDLPHLSRISDYTTHYVRTVPDRTALVFGEHRIDFTEMARRVDAEARALLACGIAKGDRVAMLCTPRPEFFITFLASASIGAIWLGLNPRYRLAEFRHVMTEARPALLIALTEIDGRHYGEDLIALRDSAGLREIVTLDDPARTFEDHATFLKRGLSVDDATLAAARADVGADDPATIIFTSGSTGAPKGAMLTHRGLVEGALNEFLHWPSERPVVLVNMPINHIAGLGMTAGFGHISGGTLVFQDRFDAIGCAHLIERERVTFWLQAPTMFHFVVTHPDFAGLDLGSLEYIIWGGSPMSEHLVRQLQPLGAFLGTAFGMTELTTYVCYSDSDATPEVLANTIGRPHQAYDLRLADSAGRPVPPGTEGEIQARGRWLMKGYFGREEATRAAFTDDGWFRTGDVAVEREDGNWGLVGRQKEMYKSGGYNIYPREIEIVLEAHPDVSMAAVLGVPDPVYHEVGHGFVQPAPGCHPDAEDLRAWCVERLANYKVPKRFTVLQELPRLPIGKIDKMELRQRCQNGAT
jgi:acyl-CoA synthetase (AMP-forming)/AMP-acid ligase II